MRNIVRLLVLVVFLQSVRVNADSAKAADAFKALKYQDMPYRLLIPQDYDQSKNYPLVLFFHGYGERGKDNKSQLRYFVNVFAKSEVRKKFPCFVVAPQINGAWIPLKTPLTQPIPAPHELTGHIAVAVDLLKSVESEYSIDERRVYVIGVSNGACAVWAVVECEPQLWAGAVSLSGAGDPSAISAARSVPVWEFHGDADKDISVELSRQTIAALKAAGGDPMYTEYPGLGHLAAIKKACTDPKLLPWLFGNAQK